MTFFNGDSFFSQNGHKKVGGGEITNTSAIANV